MEVLLVKCVKPSLNIKLGHAIKSHYNQCKGCRETMSAEQNFTSLKKYCFNTETKLMEALLNKCLKPSLNIKLGLLQGAKSLLHVFYLEVQC